MGRRWNKGKTKSMFVAYAGVMEKRKAYLGLWVRMGVAADVAKKEANQSYFSKLSLKFYIV